MRIFRLAEGDRAAWEPRIRALEESAVYPLGNDTFRLDHGEDYFAFFDRLGEVHYWVAAERERVVAVGCGIVRRVPVGGRVLRAWYGCDMKVLPERRGERIPLRMVARAFPGSYLRCPRGYGITMNPPGRENHVVRLLRRFRWIRIMPAAQLLFWSLDEQRTRAVLPLVQRHRGPVGWLSHAGRKDLVLGSTGTPMPLLHAQFGPCAEPAIAEPRPGHVHMVCAPENDALARDLRAQAGDPSATATVVAHRMEACDWRFVLSSDV